MIAKFFNMPEIVNGVIQSFRDLLLFATNQIISYEYTAYNTKTGNFTLVIPFDKDLISDIRINDIICIDDDTDWLIIESISYDYRIITLTGKDCKAFLGYRVSEIPVSDIDDAAVENYDAVVGKTAYCLKHYLDENVINPENVKRKMPFNEFSDETTGIDDHYLAKFDYISDIADVLCDNAGIGWRVSGRLATRGFDFSLYVPVDRSFGQNDRQRVIFSVNWRNVSGISFEHDISNQFNIVYADRDGYITVYQNTATDPSGIARRECKVDISGDVPADQAEDYALEQVKDNIETQSYELTVPGNCGYGTEFSLGDIVSVSDSASGNMFSGIVSSATKSFGAGQRAYRLIIGNQKPKLLNRIINNMLSGTQKRR